MRERSPGVWEVRVVVGFDPARARSIQRSFTVHGDAVLAGRARRELVAEYGSMRSDVRCAASAVTVGELLEAYMGSALLWKPATVVSHRHVVSNLAGDPLCRCRLQSLTPAVMRAAICHWSAGRVRSRRSWEHCRRGVKALATGTFWLCDIRMRHVARPAG